MRTFFSRRIALLKVVAVIVGILMIVFSMGDAVKIWKKDFGKIYEKGRTDYSEDELITGKIEYVFGTVATLESTQTVYGIPVKKQLTPYYLCFVTPDKGDEYFVIVHATDKDTIKTMDSLTIHTNFVFDHPEQKVTSNTDPVYLEVKARPVPEEVMGYTMEYMKTLELSENDIKKMFADYMLEEQDFSTAKFLPLIGLVIALIPILMFIVSKKRAKSFKNSRTHYVNQGPDEYYNTPPSNTGGEPMRRYSAQAYEAHTYPGGYNSGDNASQGQETNAEMDSIDTSNLKL